MATRTTEDGSTRKQIKFKRGQKVRCEREAPSRGTWPQFAGKVGFVRVPDNLGEVGVVFGSLDSHSEPTTWFLPSELVPVGDGPA